MTICEHDWKEYNINIYKGSEYVICNKCFSTAERMKDKTVENIKDFDTRQFTIKFISFKEAFEYIKINNLEIINEFQSENDATYLVLSNRMILYFKSVYEEDWSDVTPGEGI